MQYGRSGWRPAATGAGARHHHHQVGGRHLVELTSEVHRPSHSADRCGPRDRPREGPVHFAHARSVAEAGQRPAVAGRESASREPHKRLGRGVEERGPRRWEIVQILHPTPGVDRPPGGGQSGGKRLGEPSTPTLDDWPPAGVSNHCEK